MRIDKLAEQYKNPDEFIEVTGKSIRTHLAKAESIDDLAIALYDQSHFSHLIKVMELALEYTTYKGDLDQELKCYMFLGDSYFSLGDYLKAKQHYEKALNIAIEIGERYGNSNISYTLGAWHIDNNQIIIAYGYLKKCIELGESIGRRLIEEQHKIGFYGRESDVYQLIVPVCVQLNKKDEAFEFAERSKSKAFIDLLTTSNIIPSLSPKNKDKEERLKELLAEEEKIVRKMRFT